jgi:hypothetical protein
MQIVALADILDADHSLKLWFLEYLLLPSVP